VTSHTYQPAFYHPTFGGHAPALRVNPGDSVTTFTLDAHGYDQFGKKQAAYSNPLVGPFYVEGAAPGDTLAVRINHLKPNRGRAWSYCFPLPETVENAYVPLTPAREALAWALDEKTNTACPVLDESAPASLRGSSLLAGLRLEMQPMIGCIGTAPPLKQAITSYSSGEFGGNMDCALVQAGSTIYLPVFEPGGLLFLGDCHARQCDGEISGAAMEVSGEVEFSVDVLKGQAITHPRGENATHIFSMGCARPLDCCVQLATSEMQRMLTGRYGVEEHIAWALMSQAIEFLICNNVSSNFTAACKLAKKHLPAA
jgi:acetamidase/formamidase